MKIGVISDTHGLLRPEVKEILKTCDEIIHAGDIDNENVLEALKEIAPIHIVRGNNDKEWARWLVPEADFELAGKKVYLVHDKRDIPRELGGREIIIYGHSHQYDCRLRDGRLWLNPGSCGPRRFFQEPTMAVLVIGSDGSMEVERIDLPVTKGKQHGDGTAPL